MRILQRYLLREMSLNFAAVTLVALALLLVNVVGSVLARAAQLQYQKGFVLELIGLGAAQEVAILLPFGLLLGVVLAFGRLYHDSEMAAAQACGVGVGRVSVSVWALALPVTVMITWLNFYLAPRAAAAEVAMRNEALRAALTAPPEAGKFRSFDGGRIVVYAHATTPSGELSDVFVNHLDDAGMDTTVAKRARYSVSADGENVNITLFDGERREGAPGSNQYRIMRFADQLTIPLRTPAMIARSARIDELPTAAIIGSRDPKLRAEFQWRLGLPLMSLILTVFAIPVGRLRPRQGRYAHVWIAVLIFALYANIALAARTWMEREVLPPALGLWWVHALFLLLGVVAVLWPRIRRLLPGFPP